MKRPKLEHVGIVIHIIAVLVVWILFLLPVIFYYRSREGSSIGYLSDLSDYLFKGTTLEGNSSFNETLSNELCQGVWNKTLDLSVNVSLVRII